jgi:ubiquinone/menaquinone biosynthesis C-methylase UbiE
MDFNERVIPGITSNFQLKQSLARYYFAFKYLKKKQKVVDVGCGTGYGSAVLAEKCEVVGLDNNLEAIEFAKKNYGDKVKFLVSDANKLPLKGRQFDVAVSFEVIEHLKEEKNYLTEINRVLKNNGIFILSTPNISVYGKKVKIKNKYHKHEYSYNELLILLQKYFRKVEVKGQKESLKFREAYKDFLKSQTVRKKLAQNDIFNIRKILNKDLKEKIWKHIGNLFGRKSQENISVDDFPINSNQVNKSEYFVAICQK